MPNSPFLFAYQKQDTGTAYYHELYKITTIISGVEVDFGTIQRKPRPSFLDSGLVQVKLHNRLCYSPDIVASVKAFCREFGIEFKNYTRIDYAVDFQRVNEYGADIQRLLHAFASRELVLKGKAMKVHSGVKSYTGITWGSRASGVSISMYNKTVEMNKKTSKPWILAMWEEGGFDMEADTYRLEISTKKPRFDAVDEDGLLLGTYTDIDFLNSFEPYFDFLYRTQFQVAKAVPGVRFARCEKYTAFVLFSAATSFRPRTQCTKPQSSNIKKTVIKNIVFEAMLLQHRGQRVEASYAWELAMRYVDRYSLQKWWGKTFERLNIKSSALTHWDIVNNESILKHTLKEAEIWN